MTWLTTSRRGKALPWEIARWASRMSDRLIVACSGTVPSWQPSSSAPEGCEGCEVVLACDAGEAGDAADDPEEPDEACARLRPVMAGATYAAPAASPRRASA
ncbi:MAG: hypothetical protein GKR99_19435 [Rhodobacteraceae bacterium]|nr:hypothetical protein [Paracoccaceae bacterium]